MVEKKTLTQCGATSTILCLFVQAEISSEYKLTHPTRSSSMNGLTMLGRATKKKFYCKMQQKNFLEKRSSDISMRTATALECHT